MPIAKKLRVRFATGNDTPVLDVFDQAPSDICIYRYEGGKGRLHD